MNMLEKAADRLLDAFEWVVYRLTTTAEQRRAIAAILAEGESK